MDSLTKRRLKRACDRQGLTVTTAVGRLLDWYLALGPNDQSSVLGLTDLPVRGDGAVRLDCQTTLKLTGAHDDDRLAPGRGPLGGSPINWRASPHPSDVFSSSHLIQRGVTVTPVPR